MPHLSVRSNYSFSLRSLIRNNRVEPITELKVRNPGFYPRLDTWCSLGKAICFWHWASVSLLVKWNGWARSPLKSLLALVSLPIMTTSCFSSGNSFMGSISGLFNISNYLQIFSDFLYFWFNFLPFIQFWLFLNLLI